jgi:bifunctional non-homologous end joining protein LigD
MLATVAARPFHLPGWVYEEKYDGYRILAYKEGAQVTLRSRNGRDRTASFAAIADSLRTLPARTLLLDGEVVAFDDDLVSRFQLLQEGKRPLVYAVFDCLYRDGRDLRREPLARRRVALARAIARAERCFLSRRLGPDGLAAYRQALANGFEGLVAKDAASRYVAGRSSHWRKVKILHAEEFVIGGCTTPAGTRARFGALLLGAYRGTALRYVGKVGTGFSEKTLESLWRALGPLARPTSPFVDPPAERGVTWVAPRLVAQVSFTEWTRDAKLRQPVFLGLRDDKRARDVRLPRERA